MAAIKTSWQGGKQMQNKLYKIRDRYPNKIRAGLTFRAEVIMETSKRDFVPVHLGNLKSSGHVRPPVRGTGDQIWVELVYGGPSEPYAVVQHEVHYDHIVGQWKYLEQPIDMALPTLLRDIARDIRLTQELIA